MLKNPVVTIGTFDGVHLGHQRILRRIQKLAAEIDGQSLLVSFDPHPREIIYPDRPIQLLSTQIEKIHLLQEQGLDHLLIIPFSRNFSEMQAEAYVEEFLIGQIKPKMIVIGYDHRFGKNRSGDIDLLRNLAPRYGVRVEEIEKKEIEAAAVSSTRIREALNDGQVDLAEELLGRTYSLEGIVVRGDQIGRKLGYPTANLKIQSDRKLIPGEGIYVVLARINGEGKHLDGVMSIGTRPTFDGEDLRLEVHLFSFNQDIYGASLQVDFIEFLRKNKKFETQDELIAAINADSEKAKKILSKKKRD
jgi:riboflavin kinase/FMN adenylyltransferase